MRGAEAVMAGDGAGLAVDEAEGFVLGADLLVVLGGVGFFALPALGGREPAPFMLCEQQRRDQIKQKSEVREKDVIGVCLFGTM